MRQTFLEKSAEYIFKKHTLSSIRQICVVLPSRRSVYFFKRALAQCSSTPFLAPEIVAIDDFVAKHCGLEIIDNVSLLFELYDVFKNIDTKITFDRYLQWAHILLKDLDQIDKYLIDTDYLFDYLTEAKSVERWQLEWSNSQINLNTERIKSYFELFANLKNVYREFRLQLQSKQQAYSGMAYRIVAENAFELFLDQPEVGSPFAPPSFFYFVGLNALSAAEEKIIKTFIKAQKAEVLWDTDFYYMRDNAYVEGGKLLRKYKEATWSGEWKWSEDLLQTTQKEIHTYAVPNASMQPKVAGELYKQWVGNGQGGSENRPNAIVLSDENLLIPLLNSLDDDAKDLNITMGLTLRNSLLFTLIEALFELQTTVAEFRTKDGRDIKIQKYNHRTVEKVLNHPFIRRYEYLELKGREVDTPTIIQQTLQEIKQRNLVYLDVAQLMTWSDNHPLFQVLFTRWGDKPQNIIEAFYKLIDLLRTVYKNIQNAIETEYLYLFYTLLKNLENTLQQEHIEKLNVRSFRAFLYELIKQTRIPFSGEPVGALQIMGVLETRALDFERLIILSVNEGVLPQHKRQNSLIAWDIAKEVGLPIYTDNDANISYYFYRLLQRAKEVHLVYITDPNLYSGGEKSRFILQVQHELVPLSKGNIKYIEHVVAFQPDIAPSINLENLVNTTPRLGHTDWSVPKTPDVIEFIQANLQDKGLYATHLNEYLRCSLQYYFKRFAGIEEEEEVEEKMGSKEYGVWIHAVLERIDIAYLIPNKPIEEAEIKHILAEEFKKQFGSYDHDAGINRLIYQVATQSVLDFIQFQQKEYKDIEVLDTERTLSTVLPIIVSDQKLFIKIAGKIDRIELLHNTLRVADYKTGKVEVPTKINLDKVQTILSESTTLNDEKIRQLWFYQYLIYKEMLREQGLWLKGRNFDIDHYKVVAGFYGLRSIKKGFVANPLRFDDSEDAEVYIALSERYIEDFIINKLLNTAEPFQKTTNLSTCQYCDFREICGR